MWHALLGLPEPIIKASAAENRLGEIETRRAKQAFTRASGHGAMTRLVFVHSVLREILPSMPVPLCERLFATINTDLSGALKYKEFISAVAVLKVGTTREKLKFLFRMMDSSEAGTLGKGDVRTFLLWTMTAPNVAAMGLNGKPWNVITFESELFQKNEKLKLDAFRNRLGNLKADKFAIVEWMNALASAMTFEEIPGMAPSIQSTPRTTRSHSTVLPPTVATKLGMYTIPTWHDTDLYNFRTTCQQLRQEYSLNDTVSEDAIAQAIAVHLDRATIGAIGAGGERSLREWLQRLVCIRCATVMEAIGSLFDFFVDLNKTQITTQLTDFLSTSHLEVDVILEPYTLVPPSASALYDELLGYLEKEQPPVSFEEYFTWLQEYPMVLNSWQQLIEEIHGRLVTQKDSSQQVALATALLQSPDSEPKREGCIYFAIDSSWWQAFAKGSLKSTEKIRNQSPSRTWINMSIWNLLQVWFPSLDVIPIARLMCCVSPLDPTISLEIDPIQVVLSIDDSKLTPSTILLSRSTHVNRLHALLRVHFNVPQSVPISIKYRVPEEKEAVVLPSTPPKGAQFLIDLAVPNGKGPILEMIIKCPYLLSPSPTSAAEVEQPTTPVVGLSNLGNTCYMNSVLQCLFHTSLLQEYFASDEYLYDLNVTNPMGMKGILAVTYAELVHVLASLSTKNANRPIAPQRLRFCMGKAYSSFAGNLQHDAHEFLSVLLSGLSEDLCRPLLNSVSTSKPYFSLADSNDREDSDVAKEWWTAHVLRDPSVITALFTGQFKSALECQTCHSTSNRFEPFSFLQVPLPPEPFRWVSLIYRTSSHTRHAVQVRVPTNGTIGDILNELSQLFPSPDGEYKVACILNQHKIQHVLKTASSFAEHSLDHLQVLAVPTNDSNEVPVGWIQCVHRYQRMVPFYFRQPFRLHLFGNPLLIPLPMSGENLYKWLNTNLVLPDQQPTAELTPKASMEFAIPNAVQNYSFTVRQVLKPDGLSCAKCPWTTFCIGCVIDPTDTTLLSLTANTMLSIDWGEDVLAQRLAIEKQEVTPEASSPIAQPANTRPSNSLEECLEMLCSLETLEMGCGTCKDSTDHSKKLSLYTAPPVLVVQLKRFQNMSDTSHRPIKAENAIAFPITGLDLAPFMTPASSNAEARTEVSANGLSVEFPVSTASNADNSKYDIYGVVCHHGVLGAGHYVAYIKDSLDRWWYMDDTNMTSIPSLEMTPKIMQSAYILFYQRQDMNNVNLLDWFPRRTNATITVNIESIKNQLTSYRTAASSPPKSSPAKARTSWTNAWFARMQQA
ncbi:hypothetical protein THRCLA_20453 [Thraustotheca clavata]|uniref:ubiquitinyl hydrolase 1 n=1 Tax=Thraustotheca clavata TaxID=74557 RepID=A0A1W0A794_9STRA|nr:hypothetical protein THRCLA_20453 [Thraustotheca clavata]